MKGDEHDPKGLIRESFRIEGITAEECRTIFLDWALSIDGDTTPSLKTLADRYKEEGPHPMLTVLQNAQQSAKPARRRGGWRGARAQRSE